MKILIVEDNEKNLKLFREVLDFHGHQTLIARDGEEGVRMARENIPGLILMDIQMPVKDGFAALKDLRADDKTKDIRVIALTSYAMKGDRERFLSDGFADYISKPIEVDRFIEVIERNIKGQKVI